MDTKSEKNNVITQSEYDQIQALNQKAFDLMQDFIENLDEFFIDVGNKYGMIFNIKKIYDFKNGLELQSKNLLERINIISKLGEESQIKKDGKDIIVKYYFNDVYKVIKNPATQQILILKKYTKKMFQLIRHPEIKKDFQKIRMKTRRKLKKLEDEQNTNINININIPQM